MSEAADDARDALLANAAGPDGAGVLAEAAVLADEGDLTDAGVGDLLRYLRAYYRHVPVEDLAAAGPARIKAVAVEHARLAAGRPQGRAEVRVRPAGGAAFGAGRAVVDIVTDDMPFLVDSVTMALARHDLDSDLVVHPQLLVRRNVAGALREVDGPLRDIKNGGGPGGGGRGRGGPGGGSAGADGAGGAGRPGHDEIAESWTHIEIAARPGAIRAAELEQELRRVLHDVRVAVAVRLADRLAAEEGPRVPAETQALLRWLADNHFTFLGYREYDLVDGPDG